MPQATWPWMPAEQTALNPSPPPPAPARGLNVKLSTGPNGERMLLEGGRRSKLIILPACS
jgi:hypothetical protein